MVSIAELKYQMLKHVVIEDVTHIFVTRKLLIPYTDDTLMGWTVGLGHSHAGSYPIESIVGLLLLEVIPTLCSLARLVSRLDGTTDSEAPESGVPQSSPVERPESGASPIFRQTKIILSW